jgi:hypothetical protein
MLMCSNRILSGEERNGMNPYSYRRGSFGLCPEGGEDFLRDGTWGKIIRLLGRMIVDPEGDQGG